MLHRKYASSSSLDSLNEGGSLHSLDEAEAQLDHIEGSPFHHNLEPRARPKKKPPKGARRNETYLSPQPWGLEPPNRSFQEDLLDTSPAASPGRLNDELRVSPGFSPGALAQGLPSRASTSTARRASAGGATSERVNGTPSVPQAGPSSGEEFLPQLVITAAAPACKSRRTSQPTNGAPGGGPSGGPPRQRRGTLPPTAVPDGGTLNGNTSASAAKNFNSAPQLRSNREQPILAPTGRRRSSANNASSPAATARGLPDASTVVAPRAAAACGPRVQPTPPTSRRTSGTNRADAPPAPTGRRPSGTNGRPPMAVTANVAPQTAQDADVNATEDRLVAAVERFNTKFANGAAPGGTRKPAATRGSTRGQKPEAQTAAPAQVPPQASTQEQCTLAAAANDLHAGLSPQLFPAVSLQNEEFLFDTNLEGTMNTPYYGLGTLSTSEKKLQPDGVFGDQSSPSLGDMLAKVNDAAATPSVSPQAGPSASTAPRQAQRNERPSRTRNGGLGPIDAQSATRWTEEPAQMSVNQSQARRSIRRPSRSEAAAANRAAQASPANGLRNKGAASTPQPTQRDSVGTTPAEQTAASTKRSVPPPSVEVPSAADHKPCIKAKNAKQLPPPVAPTRKQGSPASASRGVTTSAGLVMPRQYQQRQLPQRPRGQSIPSANPNDNRLVTLADIRQDILREGGDEKVYTFDT